MLRLPGRLHKRLTQTAEKAGRSLNHELVERLEHSFVRDNAEEILKRARGHHEGVTRLYSLVAGQMDLPPLDQRYYGLLAPDELRGKPITEENWKIFEEYFSTNKGGKK
jgi:Arc-like DNA binding domain